MGHSLQRRHSRHDHPGLTGPSPRTSARYGPRISFALLLSLSALSLTLSGCTLKQLAVRSTAAIIEDTFAAFNEEEDPVLAEAAAASNLKLLEGLLKSDPANPKFLDQFTALGQIVGDPEHEEAYLMNPRAGNRTSWMGSRMPPFLTKPVEEGGKYAFGGMAALGLYILDVSDPTDMKQVGHVNTAPRFAGTEFDNVDVSQYERTGYVFANGYPMNDECFEPFKDIFVIDANDVTHPKVVAKFPRPTPPEGASFDDYCQRRGSFGPKRPGYHVTQPGRCGTPPVGSRPACRDSCPDSGRPRRSGPSGPGRWACGR